MKYPESFSVTMGCGKCMVMGCNQKKVDPSMAPKDSSHGGHSRKATAASLDSTGLLADDPVTTTKALLVQIVAPRKFVISKAMSSTASTTDQDNTVDTATIDKGSSPADKDSTNKIPSTLEIETTNNNEKDEPSASTSKRAEEAEPKEDEGKSDNIKDGNNQTQNVDITQTYEINGSQQKPPEIDMDPTEESQEITPEELATVVKKDDHPEQDAVVNVEELLRITFNNLAVEWHLLNIPTYTIVRHLSQAEKEAADSVQNKDKEEDAVLAPPVIPSHPLAFLLPSSNKQTTALIESATAPKVEVDDTFEWIMINVMVRPPSLGIILDRVERIGVGTYCGTLNVFKAELCRTASPYAALRPEPTVATSTETTSAGGEEEDANESSTDNKNNNNMEKSQHSSDGEALAQTRAIEAARAEWKNAATRLRVEQVREQIIEQAAFSFDFIALLTVASILAGVGLITNNTVVIVASMLVSPIMGPVLGLTFGTRIADWPMVRSSLMHETLALAGCVVIGSFVGLAASFTSLATDTWPTNEMESRGEVQGLLTGIAIAIPSGMGVCLSILGGNTSSLVGVAISASLLPPAVNTGICLVYGMFLKAGSVDTPDSLKDAQEFAKIGGISFALTVINIFCIWISGLVMFEIKEVAPTQSKNAFWAKDIKVARELNQKKDMPPVDVSVIRRGLKSVLNRTPSQKPVNKIKLQPFKRGDKGAVASGATRNFNLNSAFALKSQNKKQTRSFFGWGAAADDEAEGDEETDENVRYIGLEDMARLLGFDDEDVD